MIINVALGDSGSHVYFNLANVTLIFNGLKSYNSGTFSVNKFKISTHALITKKLELRLRSLIRSFRDQVNKRNKEGLEPKLRSNAQLSPECKESVRKEIEE